MTQDTYRIRGMHCASCASIIEKALKKIEGVDSIEVNIGTEKAKISYDETKTNPKQLSKIIEPLGYTFVVPTDASSAVEMGMSESEHAAHLGLNQTKDEKLAEIAAMKRMVISAIPLAAFSVFVMAWEIFAQFGILPIVPFIWREF